MKTETQIRLKLNKFIEGYNYHYDKYNEALNSYHYNRKWDNTEKAEYALYQMNYHYDKMQYYKEEQEKLKWVLNESIIHDEEENYGKD